MDWIRNHPYAFAITGACILVVVGTLLVISHSGTPAFSGISAWSGNTGVSTVPNAIPAPSNDGTPISDSENYGTQTLPYSPSASTTGATSTTNDDSSYDFNALLTELSQASASKNPAPTSGSVSATSNAWAYIPTGLISTSSATQSTRTPLQQALWAYGNEVGSYVQGYNDTHQNQVQVMENALNDRQNPAKAQLVASLGTDLETAGTGIAELENVPQEALLDNTAFANSFSDSGKKLIALSQALPGRDADLATAIETYDTSMNTYITDYVALANLFKSYGVTFSSSDPGSVFTFSAANL